MHLAHTVRRLTAEAGAIVLLAAGLSGLVAQPAVSATDRPLVFIGYHDGDSSAEVYRVNPDGSDLTKLTDDSDRDEAPAISPDGTQVAYGAGFAAQLRVVPIDGGTPTALTDDGYIDSSPSWSPDGARIAFTRYDDETFFQDLMILDVASGEVTALTTEGAVRSVDWSPNGDLILFRNANSLETIRPDGTDRQSLDSLVVAPDWAPDGQTFVGTQDGAIKIFDRDGNALSTVTDSGDYAAFSPDGAQVAIARTEYDTGGQASSTILTADLDGSNESVVFGPATNALQPDWGAYPAPPPTPTPRDITDTCDDHQDTGYSDVDDSNVHSYSISCAGSYEVTRGTGDGSTYSPQQTLTKGQTASFLVNTLEAAGTPAPSDAPQACGADNRTVHTASIERLIAAGVIASGADNCAANDAISRARMAGWTHGAIEFGLGRAVTTDDDYYTDDESSEFEAEINAITSLGVVTGTGQGEFSPADTLRRAPMATFLARSLDTILDG